MELTVERVVKTDLSTIGNFSVDGVFECYCLEPTDRGLTSDMTLQQIQAIKIQNKTAVPIGRYAVTQYDSPKNGTIVPLLEAVPDYGYVEIHVGNFPQDTDGCLLLGTMMGQDEILNSRDAINAFYSKFFAALDAGEDVFITYQYPPDQTQSLS
jgi:hypothetical protein